MKPFLHEIATWDWDVGDQGRPDGFAVRHKRSWYQVVIEGWGEECLEGGPIEALDHLVDQWCAGYEFLGFKTFRYQNPNCLLVSFAVKKIRGPGGLEVLEIRHRNPPAFKLKRFKQDQGVSWRAYTGRNLVAHISGFEEERKFDGVWIPCFHIYRTHADEKVRGTGLYRSMVQQVANQYPGGAYVYRWEASGALQGALSKLPTWFYQAEEERIWVRPEPRPELRQNKFCDAIKAQFRRNPPAPSKSWFSAPFQYALARIQDNQGLLAGEIPARLKKADQKFISVVIQGLEAEIGRVKAIQRLASEGGIQLREFKNPKRNSWAFISPSAYYQNCFRISEFNLDGWTGHQDGFLTPEDAAYEMLQGYSVPDPGRLAELMKTRRWKKGNKRLELHQLRHKYFMAGDVEKARAVDQELESLGPSDQLGAKALLN